MTTYSAKPALVQRKWWLIDATDKTLGRMASEIARRLRGKHKPIYTPHVDTGDYIIVINADKVTVTGKKMTDKLYHRHSGYIGHLRTSTFEKMMEKSSSKVVTKAVKGMLSNNPLGRAMLAKLKVYAGPDHPHTAQQPELLEEF